MGIEIEVKRTFVVVADYIEVQAEVRYWEDAAVNGNEDIQGDLIPFRKGDLWTPVIRLTDGAVMGWPIGMTASIHYKVCDQGEYWLLDADHQRIAKYRSHYVPDNILCQGERGYCDYIILDIGEDGVVVGWTKPPLDGFEWDAVVDGEAA